MVDRLAALARAFDVDLETMERRPSLDVPETEIARAVSMWGARAHDGARVLVNISAGTSERTWPDERYVAVMRHIRERASGRRAASDQRAVGN